MNVKKMLGQIENIVRGVVMKDNKILLCLAKETGHYFLPGGHIEFSENALTALKREFVEELDAEVLNPTFIGVMENFYESGGQRKQEYCIIFQCELNDYSIESKENHIEFVWMTKDELQSARFLPPHFKDSLIKWIGDGLVFFSHNFSS